MPVGRSSDHGSILVVPRRPGPLVALAPTVVDRGAVHDVLQQPRRALTTWIGGVRHNRVMFWRLG